MLLGLEGEGVVVKCHVGLTSCSYHVSPRGVLYSGCFCGLHGAFCCALVAKLLTISTPLYGVLRVPQMTVCLHCVRPAKNQPQASHARGLSSSSAASSGSGLSPCVALSCSAHGASPASCIGSSSAVRSSGSFCTGASSASGNPQSFGASGSAVPGSNPLSNGALAAEAFTKDAAR